MPIVAEQRSSESLHRTYLEAENRSVYSRSRQWHAHRVLFSSFSSVRAARSSSAQTWLLISLFVVGWQYFSCAGRGRGHQDSSSTSCSADIKCTRSCSHLRVFLGKLVNVILPQRFGCRNHRGTVVSPPGAELSQLLLLSPVQPEQPRAVLAAGAVAHGTPKHTVAGSSNIVQALLPATMRPPIASPALPCTGTHIAPSCCSAVRPASEHSRQHMLEWSCQAQLCDCCLWLSQVATP